ncbi:MAG: exosortase E/protease, VPEID-CTERM system [Cellvibrionaceae bacterium]|nr:exosortase E/protease, VPEID-CTERM system [Cellvibrionaceae bacterium]
MLQSVIQSPQFKPALLLAGGILLGVESLFLSQRFDAANLVLQGDVTGWRTLFSHFGSLAKLALVIMFATGLMLQHKFKLYWPLLCNAVSERRFVWMLPIQLACYGFLYYCTYLIYATPETAGSLPAWLYALWLFALSLTLASWLLMLIDPRWLFDFVKHEQSALVLGALAGLAVWGMALWTQRFWGPLSEMTFHLTAALLRAVYGDLMTVDINEKVIGLGDFWINIAPACSGYEGIGLITAFTTIYLWVHRDALKFPRALLLFPIGAFAIWLLNVVRIALLVGIGYEWSEDVAIGGFHSQAGWLTFILTSLALLWLTGDSAYFSKTPKAPMHREHAAPAGGHNPAVATLIPMVVLLAVTLLSSAFTADFDWLYPLRVLAVVIALAYVWPQLRPVSLRLHWLAIAGGAVTAVLWTLMLGKNPEANAAIKDNLAHAPTWAAALWLLFRCIGTVVTVPIAEELAFRGYLLSRFSKTDVRLDGPIPFSVMAIFFSSLAFGMLHGAWLAGTVAGIIYALVRWRTQSLANAIYAHGITNALIFGYAAATGEWHLL